MGLAVSLMIANLSYDSEMLLNQVTAGLLIAAIISGLVGSLILLITQRSNAK
jgi:NhaA family Na+:H+ antiporter